MKELTCLLACFLLMITNTVHAELRPANIFNDHMVLQQAKPLTVWGWAEPGSEVSVTLTESRQEAVTAAGEDALNRDQTVATESEEEKPSVRIEYVQQNTPKFATVVRQGKAGPNGRWSVVFEPLEASFCPKFLCIVAGKEKVALIDVLVGEVWVTAGQSNMAYSGDKTGWLDKEGLLLPGLRYAHTGRASNYKPLADLPERAAWLPCTEENVKGLSTIPYLFGKYLHSKLRVPVGIINAASGGAEGNFWCSLDEMHAIDFWAVKEMMAAHGEAVAAWENEASRRKILDSYEREYAVQLSEWEKAKTEAETDGKRPPA